MPIFFLLLAPDEGGLGAIADVFNALTRNNEKVHELFYSVVDEIKATIAKNKVDIVEMVNIDTLSDLIRFELFNTIKNKLTIKRCGYCGGYFIPRGRADMEFCNRIIMSEKKRCNNSNRYHF